MATGGSDKFNQNYNEENRFDTSRGYCTSLDHHVEVDKKTEASKCEDNPFSFKRFLQISNGNLTNGHRAPSSRITNLDLAHDLPDFVQDHYSAPEVEVRPNKHPHEIDLPDFARDMTSGDFVYDDKATPIGARPKIFNQSSLPIEEVENQSSLKFSNFFSDGLIDNCTISLPDFLSDSGVGSSHNRENITSECDSFSSLKARNTFLLKKLDELNLAFQSERERSRRLASQLQEVQKYEKDDILALENMVQQAESNLALTNNQLKTEKENNLKLQLQLQSLKNQTECLKSQPVCIKCDDSCLQGKVVGASHQITVAAVEAEKLLKQLLSGVENLKTISNLLTLCTTCDSSFSNCTG